MGIKFKQHLIPATLALSILTTPLCAKEGGSSAGLILLQGNGARASALGEAFSSVSDDISGFHYNPASLDTLTKAHASFQYQSGIFEDSFSQFVIGAPLQEGAIGVSIGYYDGGEIRLFDGTEVRNVTAKTDLAVSLGFARSLGRASFGLTGKYLSTELAETDNASAVAADVGFQIPIGSRFRFGTALQNFGTQMEFHTEGEDLPQVFRAGASYQLPVPSVPVHVHFEVPYFFNEKETSPSFGIETLMGPLAFRAGYRSNTDLEGFSAGTGIFYRQISFDYSFGLVEDFDSRHKLNLSFRFGNKNKKPAFVNKQNPDNVEIPRRQTIGEAFLNQKRKKKRSITLQAKPAKSLTTGEKKKTTPSTVFSTKQKGKKDGLRAQKREVFEINKNKLTPIPTKKNLEHAQVKDRPKYYIMKPGDTLEKIALRFYGTIEIWPLIYDQNEELINNPDIIDLTGHKIELP
ncbi:hypothetical protein BVX98_02090 [bacterium F11]|nr:hypothetical protein BVX98_02090 [bacterium F11]